MMTAARWLAARSIIARLDVPAYWRQEGYREQILRWVQQGLGGVCLFGGTVEEAARAAHEVQALSRVPLLVAADLEYGLPMRFSGGTAFPRAFALARAGRPDWTSDIARAIARQARWCGIGWNFAPVCDLATQPDNPVIGIRAFGQNPEEAVPHIRAWIQASQEEGVWACAKHFPGHGDVTVDSHEALPCVLASQEQMWGRELVPFRQACATGVAGIMLGHLQVPALGIHEEPASLSAQAVQFVRQQLGYEGVIVTDALDMGAITRHWSTAESVERALRAGVDLLLMPPEVEEAIEVAARLLERSPELMQQRRRSLLRVQQVRERLSVEERGWEEDGTAAYLALRVAWEAIEIVGQSSLVPLAEEAHVAIFACLAERRLELPTLFFRLFSQKTRCPCDMAYVDASLTPWEEQRLFESIPDATHAVVILFLPPRMDPKAFRRWYGFLEHCATRYPTVAVLCGNPFVPIPPSVAALMKTYSDTEPSVAAAALRLAGVRPSWQADELV